MINHTYYLIYRKKFPYSDIYQACKTDYCFLNYEKRNFCKPDLEQHAVIYHDVIITLPVIKRLEVGIFLSHLQRKIWKYCPTNWHYINVCNMR